MLAKVTERPRVLVVLERGDDVTWLSLRNIDTIHVLSVDQLNTYDVLLSDDVVFTKGAYDVFVAGPATGKSVKAVATSAEVVRTRPRPAEEAKPKAAKKSTALRRPRPPRSWSRPRSRPRQEGRAEGREEVSGQEGRGRRGRGRGDEARRQGGKPKAEEVDGEEGRR